MSWKRHDGRAISKGKDSVFRQVRKLKAKEIVLFPDFLRLYRAEKTTESSENSDIQNIQIIQLLLNTVSWTKIKGRGCVTIGL